MTPLAMSTLSSIDMQQDLMNEYSSKLCVCILDTLVITDT